MISSQQDPNASTPSASGEVARPRRLVRQIVGFTLSGCLGGIAIVVVGEFLDGSAGGINAPPTPISVFTGIMLSFLGAFYLTIAVHELGHVVAGLLVGFHFRFCTVGPLLIERRGGRIRLALGFHFLAGGLAGTFPVDARRLRRRMAVMIAAGPVTTLVFGLTAYGLVYGGGGGLALLNRIGFWPFGVLFAFLGTSAIILVVSLVPHRPQGFSSDGAILWVLARGGPRMERYLALVVLNGMMLGLGRRPRDLDPDLIARSLVYRDGTAQDVAVSAIAYSNSFDLGDIEAAGRHLDAMVQGWHLYPPAFRPSIDVTAAFFTAAYRNDPATARVFLGRVGQGALLQEPHSRPAAEAAILLAEGMPDAACRKAEEALRLTERSLIPGGPQTDIDAIRGLIARAEAALAGEPMAVGTDAVVPTPDPA